MDNNSVSNVYNDLVDSFLNRNNLNKLSHTLLVLKGFPVIALQAFSDNDVSYLMGKWNGEYIDYNSIDSKSVLSAACSFKNLKWCFYEELISLTDTLNDLSIIDAKIIIVRNNIFNEYFPIQLPSTLNTQKLVKLLEDETTGKNCDQTKQIYSDYRVESETLFLSYVNRHFMIDTNIKIDELDFYNKKKSVVRVKRDISIEISSLPIISYQLQSGYLSDTNYVIYDDDTKEIRKKVDILNRLGHSFSVSFSISLAEERQNLETDKYVKYLQRYWGENANYYEGDFYKNPAIDSEIVKISQGIIIADIIKQCENARGNDLANYSDVIVTAPTGSGKSVLFQIPGIYLHTEYKALTIVISPLVALMVDQVTELEERGVTFATYINSAITYEERQTRISGITDGDFSLVYLSPELLLSYDIRTLVGDREIGLMVIDEAHLVTTWGRDFRVDYWFLGDHIERLRRGSAQHKISARPFPILCLTATAVFGGKDDVVGDLQSSLHLTCYSDHLYIGYVRRDNINFKIRHPDKALKSDKDSKVIFATEAIHGFIGDKQKTIVYFPYKSQIEDVYINMQNSYPAEVKYIEKYYSGELSSIEKFEAYQKFRDSESIVMLATKAFGMGINISDIVNVYHFAPTGTLADYVQEIGRAARKLDEGYAITDYLKTDMHYARTLWGLSGLRHYQLRAIMKKIYALYSDKRRRNLLFTPDTFNYLFDQSEVEVKVKSGLMLISADLLEKYHFRVLNVRPKSLFTKQYVIVPKAIEKQFMKDFGKYCEIVKDCLPIQETGRGNSKVTIIKSGNIYEIDLGKIWETIFSDITFASFKYKFFNRELFKYKENITPNTKLTISYDKSYEDAVAKVKELAKLISNTFSKLKQSYGGKNFTFQSFYKILTEKASFKIRQEYARMLLDFFCYNYIDIKSQSSDEWKFIARIKYENSSSPMEMKYAIRTVSKHTYIYNNILRYLIDAKPNTREGTFVAYLPIPKNSEKQSPRQFLASLMQLFDIATYELSGGNNPAIFVRLNDPLKLRRLVESGNEYRNNILTDIERRHTRAIDIMNSFMGKEHDNSTRWEIIEDYFLGYDEIVDEKLEISV